MCTLCPKQGPSKSRRGAIGEQTESVLLQILCDLIHSKRIDIDYSSPAYKAVRFKHGNSNSVSLTKLHLNGSNFIYLPSRKLRRKDHIDRTTSRSVAGEAGIDIRPEILISLSNMNPFQKNKIDINVSILIHSAPNV